MAHGAKAQRADDGGQRTEDRGQTFDKLRLNRGQRTEDRGQRTEPQKSVISIKFPEEFYITPFQGCISMALAQLRRLAYRGKLLSQTIIMKSRLDFI